ncbi:efflux RND transporter permease subunit [Rhodospirillaceae bacterium KN72]|uniref:Efflux RND transporter permease subunit n=1 Tax=Pacificispira spongiicola TaxID=2729598 RepID=A0A7Y0DZZ8_9PROT|nr:efflux RND transporter permease subunit [Pacificispira spongiicola]NMM44712.1 efflux RND transporter permease subunit [Pacificispira spongiicola]
MSTEQSEDAKVDTGKEDLSSLSVRRPLLALVMNLLIALAGVAAIMAVEVRELPNVDRPVVTVRGILSGASPETLDAEVTSIVEGAVARVSGIKEIRSASEENNFRVHLTFSSNVDLDLAASDVREALSRVERNLPDDVEELTVIKADADADPVIRLAAIADTLSEEELARVVETDIVPALISVDGVADVTLFGDRRRMLRVVLDPMRLTSFGLSVADVADALENAPFDIPAGSFASVDHELIVRADATADTAAEIAGIVLRDPVRIGDVADVFFGPEDAESYVRVDGHTVIGMGVVRQASSNTIEISDGIQAAVARLADRLDGVDIAIVTDDAQFIRGSVREVIVTLLLAVIIVIATLWLFLGSPSATLIPCVSIPIALIGSVAAIWAMGFSINILTLLALVLATGLIVDDSIVVLENIQRRRGHGLRGRAAAVLGARQVFFAVIATTATLISVFVPISFLPSDAGRLFREFGFVLAVAVAISSFVALTIVPALAARMGDAPPSVFGIRTAIARLGNVTVRLYTAVLNLTLRVPLVVFFLAVVGAGGAWFAFQNIDRELLPVEDRGRILIFGQGPDGTGLSYTDRQARQIEAILTPYLDSGEIETVFTIVGRWDPNRVFASAQLAPWHDRSRPQSELIAELRPLMNQVTGMRVSVISPNSLNLRGSSTGLRVALIGNDYLKLYDATLALSDAIEDELPRLSNIRISYQPTQPQLKVRIDRRRATDLNVPLTDLSETLRVMINGDEVVDLSIGDESVPILLEARGGAIDDPSDLLNLYVRTGDGALVPMSSLVSLREEGVAAQLDRYVQRRAIQIDMDYPSSYPLQQASADLMALAERTLPPGMELVLLGEAASLAETEHDVAVTYVIAIVVVFLVLVAQFESWTSAAVVVLTVPFGIAAALYALLLTGTTINIYSQIGLVMMIGLMAKNGILLVEFADQLRDRGLSVFDAVHQAAIVRLRPIAMTLISTVVGGLPLILSTGPGAEARAAIGWVVFGGLGLAAVFTLFLTPVVYLGLARLSKPRAQEAGRLDEELDHARAIPDRTT